jgi:hypothetical protein
VAAAPVAMQVEAEISAEKKKKMVYESIVKSELNKFVSLTTKVPCSV